MSKSLSGRRQTGNVPKWRDALLAAGLLPSALTPTVGSADVTAQASAKVQYESNSNVLNQQGNPFIPGTNDSRKSDTYLSEEANLEFHDFVGRQDFFLNASATRFQYAHLTELDHTGYALDGGVLWKVANRLNGNLEVSRSRTMTPFIDTSATSLSLTTEQRESALASYKIAADWRLDGKASTHTQEQTQAIGADTRLSEQSGTVALNYLGFGNFSSGVDAGYVTGKYTGGTVNIQPSYHQVTFDLLGSYKAGGRSTFAGSVGYSDRVSATGLNSTSGVTGDLSFQDQLTPKTGIALDLRREINSYLTTAGSEIDTTARGSVNWRATYKLEVHVDYAYTYREFPDQTPVGYTVGTKRLDAQQSVQLNFAYHATRWLDLRLYGNKLLRDSNAAADKFNATIYGVSFVVKTPKPPGRK